MGPASVGIRRVIPDLDMRESPDVSSRPIQENYDQGFTTRQRLMSDKAAASLLTLDINRAGNAAVVRCHGKLVAGVNDILYVKVSQLFPDSKRIVLDLTYLTHTDSMGLGTLVRLYVSARSAGCDLELINLGKQIRQLLVTTNLLSVFTVIGERGIRMG
jgi:anti-sigma B factor antagonist